MAMSEFENRRAEKPGAWSGPPASVGERSQGVRGAGRPRGAYIPHASIRLIPRCRLPMHLVQLFLPLHDNAGSAFPKALFDAVRAELTDRFGGVTAFVRSPAVGAWEDEAGTVQRDEVVLVEVMAPQLDRRWWASYREDLQRRFAQDEVLIRATEVERL